ncbi:MAG: hypothetical protein AAFY41_18090, partial [Bacteroidota bacterium]
MKKRCLIIVLWFIAFGSWAQTDTTKTQGEVISGEIVIEKDKQIILPAADKVFLKSYPQNFRDQPVEVDFEIKEPNFEWPDYKSDVPFQFFQDPYPLAKYQNYVKLGYGNYNSPLIEAGLFQRLGVLDTHTKLFYESFDSGPVNNENSRNAIGGIDFKASFDKESFSLSPAISFENQRYNFYGNTNRATTGFPDQDTDEISMNSLEVSVTLEGERDDISYSLKPKIGLLRQNLVQANDVNQTEFITGAEGAFNYKLAENFNTGLALDFTSGSYRGGELS